MVAVEEETHLKREQALASSMFKAGAAGIALLTVAVTVNNSYIVKICGVTHDFWSNVWNSIYNIFGRSDFLAHMIGTLICSIMYFVIFNALFFTCDVTGHPTWLLKYKIQEGKNQPVDRKKLLSCIKIATFNLTIVAPLFNLTLYPFCWYFGSFHTGELPTFGRFLLESIVIIMTAEVAFYYIHRMFHHPKLYVRFHKKHHEWTAPIGISSIYCEPIEMALCNILPAALGPIIMRTHLLVTWVWMGVMFFSTTLAHSGYHLPFLTSPEAHDYHHKMYNCWFGSFGFLDRLHRTDGSFAGSIEEERNYILFNLIPVSKIKIRER